MTQQKNKREIEIYLPWAMGGAGATGTTSWLPSFSPAAASAGAPSSPFSFPSPFLSSPPGGALSSSTGFGAASPCLIN